MRSAWRSDRHRRQNCDIGIAELVFDKIVKQPGARTQRICEFTVRYLETLAEPLSQSRIDPGIVDQRPVRPRSFSLQHQDFIGIGSFREARAFGNVHVTQENAGCAVADPSDCRLAFCERIRQHRRFQAPRPKLLHLARQRAPGERKIGGTSRNHSDRV